MPLFEKWTIKIENDMAGQKLRDFGDKHFLIILAFQL